MSSSKKKRRRSSLAPQKVQMNFESEVGGDLYKTIDGSLPGDQRLQILANKALKFSVSRLKEEAESRGYTDGLELALMYVPQKLDSEEARKLCHSACQSGKLLPNPENEVLEVFTNDLKARIDRYSQEQKDWNKLLKKAEHEASTAESELTEKATVAAEELSERVKSLSADYLYSFTDLTSLYKDVIASCRKHDLLVRKEAEHQFMLQRCQEEVKEIISNKLNQIHEEAFGSLNSPRRNLEHIIDFPTPP